MFIFRFLFVFLGGLFLLFLCLPNLSVTGGLMERVFIFIFRGGIVYDNARILEVIENNYITMVLRIGD